MFHFFLGKSLKQFFRYTRTQGFLSIKDKVVGPSRWISNQTLSDEDFSLEMHVVIGIKQLQNYSSVIYISSWLLVSWDLSYFIKSWLILSNDFTDSGSACGPGLWLLTREPADHRLYPLVTRRIRISSHFVYWMEFPFRIIIVLSTWNLTYKVLWPSDLDDLIKD